MGSTACEIDHETRIHRSFFEGDSPPGPLPTARCRNEATTVRGWCFTWNIPPANVRLKNCIRALHLALPECLSSAPWRRP